MWRIFALLRTTYLQRPRILRQEAYHVERGGQTHLFRVLLRLGGLAAMLISDVYSPVQRGWLYGVVVIDRAHWPRPSLPPKSRNEHKKKLFSRSPAAKKIAVSNGLSVETSSRLTSPPANTAATRAQPTKASSTYSRSWQSICVYVDDAQRSIFTVAALSGPRKGARRASCPTVDSQCRFLIELGLNCWIKPRHEPSSTQRERMMLSSFCFCESANPKLVEIARKAVSSPAMLPPVLTPGFPGAEKGHRGLNFDRVHFFSRTIHIPPVGEGSTQTLSTLVWTALFRICILGYCGMIPIRSIQEKIIAVEGLGAWKTDFTDYKQAPLSSDFQGHENGTNGNTGVPCRGGITSPTLLIRLVESARVDSVRSTFQDKDMHLIWRKSQEPIDEYSSIVPDYRAKTGSSTITSTNPESIWRRKLYANLGFSSTPVNQ
ncbi:hypothetical protein MBM_09804 [Drepanopeziza brunnea f. sp. 'multigermtubi' MB_m1]|uniref:Uncharacterized protein n=1 Tax=Marssonina brunnea f. sp. multigermtubi (strain MB_m1) TaxID=1072389 RepID=K1W522_MARBU|nr:uncharacterized protein MBM_09804 [Drepanopeziza brunnea f. sp. 'multigermtubi' MB_m1]EKD12020.1 hypothetical protein MBM_09804 [Drepanopeziza brunnea f. sp. 'multigermtubi' MB_m1]